MVKFHEIDCGLNMFLIQLGKKICFEGYNVNEKILF